MNDFYKGLLALGGLVLFQVLARALRMAQVKHWCAKANKAMEAGDWASAEQSLKRCLARAPLWVPGRRMRAVLLTRTARMDEAEAEFKLAAELQPRDAEGHVQLAMFYATRGPAKAEQAAEALRTAVACAPGLKEALLRDPRFGGICAAAFPSD